MSAFGMKPQFKNLAGYREYRREWRNLYETLITENRQFKMRLKDAQRRAANGDQAWAMDAAKLQKEAIQRRAMAHKAMSLLEEAKIRWGQIEAMRKGTEEQFAEFPLTIEGARNIDFHFNKKSIEFDFIPMWTLKAKGKTYYLHHIECETPWTTRETPDNPMTKGSLRIKRGTIRIDRDGTATITES